MKKNYFKISLFVTLILFAVFNVNAQCGTNLLANGGFDTPSQPLIGNNLTGLFTFGTWSMTVGPFNIIKTDGTAYAGGPDNAKDGNQYVDITGQAGTIYQDFTITGATTNVAFGGSVSSRESGGPSYTNWTGSIDIYALPSNTLVATSSTRSFVDADGAVPAQENWYFLFGNTTLAAGNYRYIVNLGDYANFDAAFVNANCVLPIVLNSFTVQNEANSVKLSWNASEQSTCAYYDVEKSYDGVNFSKVLTQNKLNTSIYTVDDNSFKQAGVIYYRLKIVELNGSFTYSKIEKVITKMNNQIFILSNPTNDVLNLSSVSSKGQVRVLDFAGKLLITQNILTPLTNINVSTLKAGMYILQYVNGANVETQKFLKK
jgi:hypothetical protein